MKTVSQEKILRIQEWMRRMETLIQKAEADIALGIQDGMPPNHPTFVEVRAFIKRNKIELDRLKSGLNLSTSAH